MLTQRIGLLDRTGKIAFEEITAVAAALNMQVVRDLGPAWGVNATVEPLPYHKGVPKGVWPCFIVPSLPPGEGGFHFTQGNQPYAKVLYGDGWTVAASHEVCEMLVDPSGNRVTTALGIELDASGKQTLGNSPVQYLVEVCDPCEAQGYTINAIAVSDFILPAFYKTSGGTGPYSFCNTLPGPCCIIDGGYITMFDESNNEVEQVVWVGTPMPQLVNLGPITQGMALRQFSDSKRDTAREIASNGAHKAVVAARQRRPAWDAAMRNGLAANKLWP